MSEFKHIPVLYKEVLESLQIKSGGIYIDGTAGGGGHTTGILEAGGTVLAIDQDLDAITHLQKTFENNAHITIAHGNFRDIKTIAEDHGYTHVSGVLLDLGMSSFQIDASTRGFSFMKDAPLDMRMDATQTLTASDIVNSSSEDQLVSLLQKYGEEDRAAAIARIIVETRQQKKIETTAELVRAIVSSIHREGKIHPATKTFQALRIAVNDEMESLKEVIQGAVELLEPGGRIVIISFHSLEDRIVKNVFKEFEYAHLGHSVTKKPVLASIDETKGNVRARSAKMRVFEKK